jgi:hypothetical protein
MLSVVLRPHYKKELCHHDLVTSLMTRLTWRKWGRNNALRFQTSVSGTSQICMNDVNKCLWPKKVIWFIIQAISSFLRLASGLTTGTRHHCLQTGSEAHPGSYPMCNEHKAVTHLHVLRTFKKSWNISPPCFPMALWLSKGIVSRSYSDL